jgi:secondary thiamine-phosphate synthase enzyme
MYTFDVRTRCRDEFFEITDQVRDLLARSRVQSGAVVVYVPHTTAGVTINENADPDVVHDMLLTLKRLIPKDAPGYRHAEGNSDSHVKASMMSSSCHVLVEQGRHLFATSFVDLFPAAHPNTRLYREYSQYGGADTILFMVKVKHGDIFNPVTLQKIQDIQFAANALPRMFPMLMTAAGTLAAARVFIVGVGVAGLQAIATARRLGARVEAYDVRPAVKEQVQSLGARFVEMPLETADSEDKGGYAKAQDESFYRRQRELMLKVVAGSDVVITTALIPGQKAPTLVILSADRSQPLPVRRSHAGASEQVRAVGVVEVV